MIRVGTLFSGIGAIEFALKRQGIPHTIKFAGDIDKFVKQSYFANYDISEENWHNDVIKFDATRFKGEIDLLVGGSPCQSFSVAGKMKGFDDYRGNLFYEYIRIVKECQPKVFIYENVKGILSNDKGKTWQIMSEMFNSTGYKIHSKVLNAKDYGIPQSRNRVFVVGFKNNDVNFSFPIGEELKTTLKDYLDIAVPDKYNLSEKAFLFIKNKKKLYDILIDSKKDDLNTSFLLNRSKTKITKKIGSVNTLVAGMSHGHPNIPFIYQIKIKRLVIHEKGISPILPASMGTGGNNVPIIEKNESKEFKLRKLTPMECLRLMGFDDNFKIVVSDTQAYKQAGNSIVVNVLEKLLEQIFINKKEKLK